MEVGNALTHASNATSSIRHDPVIQKAQEHHNNNGRNVQIKIYGRKLAMATLAFILGFLCQSIRKFMDIVDNESIVYTILILGQFIFYSVATFFVISAALHLAARIIGPVGTGGNFVAGLINTNHNLITFVFVCFIFSYYIGTDTLDLGDSTSDNQATPTNQAGKGTLVEEYRVLFTRSSFYMAMGMAAGVFLIKNIIIYALSYNVHFFYYSERIKKNTDKINLLKAMSELVNADYSEEFETTCGKLVELISRGSGAISYIDAKHVLGEESADTLFYYLKVEKEGGMLESKDLQNFYRKTLFEQEQLSEGLVQQNSSVENLDVVATFLCFFLALSTFFKALSGKESMGQVTIIMTGLVTGGYIFADIIKKYINSLLFVFFIRPFDVGDIIMINGEISKVKEINILTSTLIQNQLTVIAPNSKLADASITNFRLSKAHEVSCTFAFNVEEYREKEKELKSKLDDYVNKRSVMFRKRMYFKDPTMVDINTIVLSIVASLNVEDMRVRKIRENQEQFILDLNAIFKEVGLSPSRR